MQLLYTFSINYIDVKYFMYIRGIPYLRKDGEKRKSMGNLAVAAANTNFFASSLHDVQGELSEVSERREELAFIISQSDSGSNPVAEAEDRRLEQIQKALETQVKLLEGLQKAAEQLVQANAKESGLRFAANG